MTKKFIFLIFMCLFGGLSSHLMAQEVITIDGTVGNLNDDYTKDSPFNTNYKYNTTQQFYYAEEIGTVSENFISSISFNVEANNVGLPFSRSLKIYMDNTTDVRFNSLYPVLMDESLLVFDGTVEIYTTGWVTINLTTPFEYTGNNILVCIYDYSNNDTTKDTKFDAFSYSGIKDDDGNIITRGLYKRDSNSYDPTLSTTAETNFSRNSHIPDVQFTFTSGSSFTPIYPTVTLTSPADGAFNPSLSFTLTNTKQYKVLLSTSETFADNITYLAGDANNWVTRTSDEVTISYIEGLKSATKYYWKVIARNGTADEDPTTESIASFTTKTFAAPGAVTNISPTDGATNLWNPRLEWTFGENTERYKVSTDGGNTWSENWTNTYNESTAGYNLNTEAGHTYSWIIMSNNGEGTTESGPFTFTALDIPGKVTNAAFDGSKLTWDFAPNTAEFRVLIDFKDGYGFVDAGGTWRSTNDATSGELEISALSLAPGETYQWCVDVRNAAGTRTYFNNPEEVGIYEFTTPSLLPAREPSPKSGSTDQTNPLLSWEYAGESSIAYKVLLGKTNSLTDENIAKDWTDRSVVATGGLSSTDTYQTSNLDNSAVYYWQIIVKDNNDNTAASDVWSFTTSLPVPTNVNATPNEIIPTLNYYYGSTTVTWDEVSGSTAYNVFVNGTQVNDSPIETNSYTIEATTLSLYSQEEAFNITVQAVSDLCESEISTAFPVKVATYGGVNITVMNSNWNAIPNATITFNGTNEFGGAASYEFTTDEYGKVEDRVLKGKDQTKYTMTITATDYNTHTESVEIGASIVQKNITLKTDGIFNVGLINTVDELTFTLAYDDLSDNIAAGNYTIYRKDQDENVTLVTDWFSDILGFGGSVQYQYKDWGTYNNGTYTFGVAKNGKSIINWANPVTRDYNIFVTDGNLMDENNWRDGLPKQSATTDIYIYAAATIGNEDSYEFGDVTIRATEEIKGSLTINGSLTANNVYNEYAKNLIINDGAQLRQNNANLKAKFVMDITNPTNWNAEGNTDGWQFIASPFTNANISDFTNVTGGYDLFKFDGTQEKEWVNQNKTNDGGDEDGDDDGGVGGIERPEENSGSRSGEETFETQFVNGRGYLASYESATTATLSGTVNNATTHTYTVAYDDENKWPNFHLLGNPFTFNMDWNNVQKSSLADGFVTIDPVNGYVYNASGTIAAGDGFFVKAIGADPTISYSEGRRGYKESSNSINLIATGNAGSDNVIINLNEEKEGFNKLDNFNKNIASIFVSKENKRYGIASYDKDITEIAVCFDAKQMGSYTIAAKPNGEFETLVLVDRFTGIETNLLEESYSFTATSNDSYDRFIVKMVNGQQTTDNSHFAYVSGEELILNIEGSVQIIDVMGRIVYTNDVIGDNNRINVSAFDNAAYVVRVINENGVKVQKIIL